MKPIVLCILDGVGIRNEIEGNAVIQAKMPTFDMLINNYPNSVLEASGKFVGLPEGQMGNSEVGHSNIGAGRIVYQPLEIINNAIKNKTFFENKNILSTIEHVKKNKSKLHICGLISDGGIHSHIDHLLTLIDLCKEQNIEQIYFHLFLDGRDSAIDSSLSYINKLEEKIKDTKIGIISTISGRYYAMDRDNRWERIKKTYDVMVNDIGEVKEIKNTIEESYKNGVYDEFIEPFIVNHSGKITSNDGIIVFNYRPDRLRELFAAITNPKIANFKTTKLNNIKLVTMFPVSSDVICTNAFEHQNLENTLGKYLSIKGKKQLRIAETEKYAHVTYFFDGGKEEKYEGKEQILVPSSKVATYDLKPEMSAYEITDKLLEEIDKYDVVILNYANGDMVGHTGNMEATVQALEAVDKCLKKLYDKVMDLNGTLLVTADHGNSEYMIDNEGNPVTTHTTNKVRFIVTNKDIRLLDGSLCDIAPTMLDLMKIEKPEEMTGKSLLIKNKESKIEKIFLLLSTLVLLTFGITYAYRFVKYYKEENPVIPEVVTDESLSNEIITNLNEEKGLYNVGNEYVFKGETENNYLLYSGILFRIVKVNSDKSIKLITDDLITSMVWGINDYETSYIRDYLNDNELSYNGIFYKLLNNADDYIIPYDYCVEKIDEFNSNCTKTLKDKVGLLSYQEYVKAGAEKSYLNINKYFWLSNNSSKGVWYVFDEGGINDESFNGNTYYSYGVRPVITLKSGIKKISGSGTKENPYVIDSRKLSTGDYFKFSDKLWKVVSSDEEKIKLVLNDTISIDNYDIEKIYSNTSNEYSPKEYDSLAYYLNNVYLNSLSNNNLIIETEWYNGQYNEDNKYDYHNIFKTTVTAKIGLLNVTEPHLFDNDNYALMTKAGTDMIYSIKNNILSLSMIDDVLKVRPVINITKNIELQGSGTLDDPYYIGE